MRGDPAKFTNSDGAEDGGAASAQGATHPDSAAGKDASSAGNPDAAARGREYFQKNFHLVTRLQREHVLYVAERFAQELVRRFSAGDESLRRAIVDLVKENEGLAFRIGQLEARLEELKKRDVGGDS